MARSIILDSSVVWRQAFSLAVELETFTLSRKKNFFLRKNLSFNNQKRLILRYEEREREWESKKIQDLQHDPNVSWLNNIVCFNKGNEMINFASILTTLYVGSIIILGRWGSSEN